MVDPGRGDLAARNAGRARSSVRDDRARVCSVLLRTVARKGAARPKEYNFKRI